MTGAIKSLSSFYAGVAIMVLEIWLLLSMFIYYNVFVNRYASIEFKSVKVIIPLLTIIAVNYLAFNRTDKWRAYVQEFDQLPKDKNAKGTWIVIGVSGAIMLSLVISFYLMSQIDWKAYR